jgi:tetratricopeptide (TPR) repeat protein
VLALALVVGVQLANSVPSRGEPDAPSVAEALARQPGVVDPVPVTEMNPGVTVDTSDLDRRIDFWHARAAQHPQSEQEWVYIGDLLDLKARLTGDVGHYIAAQEAYERAIDIAPNSVSAHSGNARLLATLHDFENAVVEATRVLQLDPYASDALGVIFDSSIELGDLENARLALDRLAERVETPALFIRQARLSFFSGDTASAISLARRSVAYADEEQAPAAVMAFYRFAVGEYELLAGNPDTAEMEYDAALDALPGYTAAIYGNSRVALARGDVETAIGLLETLPKTLSRPDMLAFLGDLYALNGDSVAAAAHYGLADQAAQAAAVGDRLIFGREYALFLADHDRPLEPAMALVEPLERVADGYGADTLAWVLFKAGRSDEALAAARSALQYAIPDPLIGIHAGLIELSAGDPARGRALIEEALALRPTASPLVIDQARRALGE